MVNSKGKVTSVVLKEVLFAPSIASKKAPESRTEGSIKGLPSLEYEEI